ncbi:hypothetical protein [Haloplanus halophilus]|uniref:transcriptional regulator FilR1 domain-containing protein n=1 Tax=Haloplanus halophilus TaxID=2949993 RepID=UPI00203C1508|nr:hypothetical protein [Haloplanus sp. GDY1]
MEQCDVSRTTVDRWINQLETASLVHRPGDRFELTLFGRVVTLKFNRVRTQLGHLIKLRDPLGTLSEEVDLDPEILASATVSFHEGLAPELAERLLTHDGRTRLIAPRVPYVFSILLFRNPNPDVELEVLIEEGLASQLDAYVTDRYLPMLSVADLEIHETRDVPPFCLALVEHDGGSTVYFVFEGPWAGMGVIETDAQEAVAWAEGLYAEYRDRTTEYEWPSTNQPFGTLPDRRQCVVLLEILAGNATHETDVMARGAEGDDGRDESLRALAEAGYVEWDRDTGAISEGPNFDDIRPILELIANDPETLPPEWQ